MQLVIVSLKRLLACDPYDLPGSGAHPAVMGVVPNIVLHNIQSPRVLAHWLSQVMGRRPGLVDDEDAIDWVVSTDLAGGYIPDGDALHWVDVTAFVRHTLQFVHGVTDQQIENNDLTAIPHRQRELALIVRAACRTVKVVSSHPEADSYTWPQIVDMWQQQGHQVQRCLML